MPIGRPSQADARDADGAAEIAIELERLPLDLPVRIEVGETGIVVVRRCRSVVAFEDRCPHAGWRLSCGDVRQGRLECAGHGWAFRLDDGKCTDVLGYRLTPLRVVIEGTVARIQCPAARRSASLSSERPRFP